MLISVVVLGIIGVLLYWLVFSRLRGVNHILLSIATIGLGILLQMVGNLIWGSQVRRLTGVVSHSRLVFFDTISTTPAQLITVAIGIVGVCALIAVMRYTRAGIRMRATADSPILAEYVGARPGRMSALAWALAGATAAAAGVGYSIQAQLDPTSVVNLGLATFPAIILGGIDSLPGAALGALILGLVESFVGVTLGGQWQAPIAYLVLVVVIVIRPRGLLGSRDVARI